MDTPPHKGLDGIAIEVLQGILSFMFMVLIGWISFLIGRRLPRDD
jgi:hypothetical protein